MLDGMHLLTQAALVAAAAGFVAFVVLYQGLTSGRWRRTSVGQNVMALMAVGAVLLTVAIVRQFAHFLDNYLEYIRLGSFTLIGVVVWWRVALLIAEQNRRDDPPGTDQQEEDQHGRHRP